MILPDSLGWSEHGIEMELIRRGRLTYVLPIIPEDAPSVIREGIARRRLAVLEYRCPCGERWTPPADAAGMTHIQISHRDHCPAISKRLRRELRRWRAA